MRHALCVSVLLALAGCQQKMAEQPRYDPLEPSRFFADGMSARPPTAGAVSRTPPADQLLEFASEELMANAADPAQGVPPSLEQAADYLDTFPMPVTLEVMKHGRERFQIYCAPCHGEKGTGVGPVVEHGYPRAASFHTERLRQAPAGYVFDVITRGRGSMPPYGAQVPPYDRWAIVAYLRALQFSQHADWAQLPEEIRQRIDDQQSN